MQTQPNSRGKPIAENYLRLIQALFRDQTIRLVSHAMHPRASSCDYLRVGLPARTYRAKDWLDWCPTLTDGTLHSSPPDSDLRHFESAPYAGPTYRLGVAMRPSITTDTSAWGGIARCRKSVINCLAGSNK